MSLIDIKMFGFDGVMKKFYDAGAKIADAREYALASAAKLIRNAVKDYGRKMTPKLNPFTGTIGKYKSGKLGEWGDINFRYQGAKMEAFQFAQSAIGRHGTEGARGLVSSLSGVRQRALKRAIKIEEKGRAHRSKFDAANDRYAKISQRASNKIAALNASGGMTPFRKLINFVRSFLDVQAGRVTIGFFNNLNDPQTDPLLEKLVAKHATGFSFPVTKRMRRFFFAIGFPFGGDTLSAPARPWIAPVFSAVKGQAIARFNERFMGRINTALGRVGYAGDWGASLEAA